MYRYNKSLPPKQLGVQHQNCKKIGTLKDIVETVRCPFWALNVWTPLIIKGLDEDQRYPFCTPLKALLKAFDWKRSWQRHYEEYAETWGQASDVPRESQWHCKDNKKTSMTNEDKPRTNLGQAEDRKRTYKGPHRQKVQLYQRVSACTWSFLYRACQCSGQGDSLCVTKFLSCYISWLAKFVPPFHSYHTVKSTRFTFDMPANFILYSTTCRQMKNKVTKSSCQCYLYLLINFVKNAAGH